MTAARSVVANSLKPSVRRISAVNGVNWLAGATAFLMTSTGPPGPLSRATGCAPVVNDQLAGDIALPLGSVALAVAV